MRLIKPSAEIIKQENLLQHVERCGRLAYKSEDKITDTSADKFVQMITKRGHTAVLEHGTVHLKVESKHVGTFTDSPYTSISMCWRDASCFYVTTNLRVIYEMSKDLYTAILAEDDKYLTTWGIRLVTLDEIKNNSLDRGIHNRISVKFTIDRGISHEFVRHRVFSFIQESTRYCNYSKDKFNNELTFIIPCWFTNPFFNRDEVILREPEFDFNRAMLNTGDEGYYLKSLRNAEIAYLGLLSQWTPQQARSVLPNSLKTELIMTGSEKQWVEFFKLRCAKDAHPQAQEAANLALDLMPINVRKYFNE